MKAPASELDAWLSSDGSESESEPEPVRRVLDALCDQSPSTWGDEDESERRFFEDLRAALSQRREWTVVPLAPPAPSARSTPFAPFAPFVLVERERRLDNDGATVRSPQLHERLAAAAAAAAPPPEPVVRVLPVDPPAPLPAAHRAPEFMVTTAVALDIPPEFREQMGKLPFKPRAPGIEVAQTMKVPVQNLLQGLTAPIHDDSIEKTVAATPFDRSPRGAAVLRIPRLTLNQYASLQAELSLSLSVSTEQSDEIQRRYFVANDAVGRALDEHWEAELAASPEMRATFEKNFADFTAWLCGMSS